VPGAGSPGDPTAREKTDFWDKVRSRSFWDELGETVCKGAKVPLRADLPLPEGFRAKPEFQRYLRPDPEGRMLLVDKAKLDIGLSRGVKAMDMAGVSVPVSLQAEVAGLSAVTRPLESAKACDELGRLADFRTVKTVYPLRADRFAAMKKGEIWTLPLVIRAGFGASVNGKAGGVPVTVSFGYSREGGVNVSLRRLDEKTLRVRIRLDHAQVYGPSAGILFTVWGKDFAGFRPESQVLQSVEKRVARQVEGYLTARLGWMAQRMNEDHALIEFTLDPREQEQMAGLQELLAGGDLEVLDTMSKKLKTAGAAFVHSKDFKEGLGELKRGYDHALGSMGDGRRSFAGTSRAEETVSGLALRIPLLFSAGLSSGKRGEHISVLDGQGGEFHLYRAHRESSRSSLELPLAGSLSNHDSRRSVLSFTHADGSGRASSPAVVFVLQDGYALQPEWNARSLAETADGVMRLAGARGRGENTRAGLPLTRIFPRSADGSTQYRRGTAAFTLVLGERAIQDVLAADARDVLRAYAAAQTDERTRLAMGRVLESGRMTAPGIREEVRVGLYYAGELARRLESIRRLGTDSKAQAKALRDLVAGATGYGLSYENVMRVLVQLVDPSRVSAEFALSAEPYDGRRRRAGGRYLFNGGADADPMLRLLSETSGRFGKPVEYSD